MTDAVFNWFYQPPLNGAAGLIMIVDQHPGPDEPGVPFVVEDLKNVIHWIEARLPSDLHLFQFKIYAADIFNMWIEIEFPNPEVRRYVIHEPDLPQPQLNILWNQREQDKRAGLLDVTGLH